MSELREIVSGHGGRGAAPGGAPLADGTAAAWAPAVRAAGEQSNEGGAGEETDRGVVTEQEQEVRPPKMYKVLLHNDDYTTMEFVVEILERVFHHSHTAATQIMLHIHRKGVGVAGVYTYEVAETKVAIVEQLARAREFPLKCTMEEA